MTRRQRISKILKLLELAKSPNPHEAKGAREKADALIAEGHVTEAELRPDRLTNQLGALGPWGRQPAVVACAAALDAQAEFLEQLNAAWAALQTPPLPPPPPSRKK